ncbi:MAG: leucyl/phenylalanyl-tRNA--protein transferase [Turneriella sp.]
MTADISQLTCRYAFPSTEGLGKEMYLGAGADLEPDTLLYAYSHGFFPWYEKEPILWCSPPERMILLSGELHLGRTLRRILRKNPYRVTRNAAFSDVMRHCAESRNKTWITPEMERAYNRLHALGFAESWEAWSDNELVGGIYAVVLNRAAFLESTFHYADNAGKICLVQLYETLCREGILLFDFQASSRLADAFGARAVEREQYERLLREAIA